MTKNDNLAVPGGITIAIGILGLIAGLLLIISLMADKLLLKQIGSISFTVLSTAAYSWAIGFGAMEDSLPLAISLMIVVLLLPIICIISGIGLVSKSRWSVSLSKTYGFLKIFIEILSIIAILIMVSLTTYESSGYPISDVFVTGIAVTIILSVISLVHPIFLVVYLGSTYQSHVVPRNGTVNQGYSSSSMGSGRGYTPPTRPIDNTGGYSTYPTITNRKGQYTGDKAMDDKKTIQIKPPGQGRRSARLVVVSGRDLHREYPIALEDFQRNPVRNVIGSNPDCQVVINGDPSVGKRHAEIRLEDGHICLFNLASTNPILLCRGIDNKIQVSGKEFLRSNDRFWLGSTELEFHVSQFTGSDLGR